MISAILIENFKRFGPMNDDEKWLPLRPITILLGPNSSGKSSVIHALLMFAQTCRRGVTGILELQTTGSLIDLGTFSNAYHRTLTDSDSRGLRIGLELGRYRVICEWDSGWRPDSTLASPSAPLVSFSVERCQVAPDEHSVFEERSSPDTPSDSEPASQLDAVSVRVMLKSGDEPGVLVTAQPEDRTDDVAPFASPWRLLGKPEPVGPHRCRLTLDDEAGIHGNVERYDGDRNAWVPAPSESAFGQDFARFIASRISELRDALDAMSHIGPLRHRGHRIYQARRASRVWRVGRDGERIVDVLLAANDGETQLTMNSYLNELDLGFELELRPTGITADAYEVILRDSRGRDGSEPVRVGIPDVGSGVGQVLPLLVQLARARRRPLNKPGFVLAEQPELHLHPRGQAKLARVLCRAASVALGETPVQMLVETHSEHLVYAIGTEIAKQRLPRSEAICLGFQPRADGGKPWVSPVGFLANGEFEADFPGGFFPEREELEGQRYG